MYCIHLDPELVTMTNKTRKRQAGACMHYVFYLFLFVLRSLLMQPQITSFSGRRLSPLDGCRMRQVTGGREIDSQVEKQWCWPRDNCRQNKREQKNLTISKSNVRVNHGESSVKKESNFHKMQVLLHTHFYFLLSARFKNGRIFIAKARNTHGALKA